MKVRTVGQVPGPYGRVRSGTSSGSGSGFLAMRAGWEVVRGRREVRKMAVRSCGGFSIFAEMEKEGSIEPA